MREPWDKRSRSSSMLATSIVLDEDQRQHQHHARDQDGVQEV